MVHFALAVMAIGIAGSGSFHIGQQQTMAVGDSVQIGGYQIKFVGVGVNSSPGDATRNLYGNLVVRRGGRTLGVLRPSATFYQNGNSPTTNVALYSRPLRDLYVVMLGTANGNRAIFDFHVNPLVEFIWWGGYLFILGTVVSLWPESLRRRQAVVADSVHLASEALYEDLAELEYDYRMGKLERTEYERNRTELIQAIGKVEEQSQTIRSHLMAEVDGEVALLRASVQTDGGVHA